MKNEHTNFTAEIKSHKRDPMALFALYPLQILLLVNGHIPASTKVIRSEYSEFVRAMRNAGKIRIGRDTHSYAVALISMIDPSAQETLLKHLDFTVRIRGTYTPLDDILLSLINLLIRWYAKNGYAQICDKLISNLVQKSEEENSADIMRHRAVLTAVLNVLVDLDRKKTILICKSQERYFSRSSGAHAAQFYWYYAFSLYVTGNTEQAKPMLIKCSKLYFDTEGRNSWVGALAMVFYHYIGLESAECAASEQYLWDFLNKMDQKLFEVNNPQSDEIRIHTRYVLLRQHMEKQTLRSLFSEISRYRKECEQHQYKTANPRLTVRTAENLLCAYYFEIGDYLNAAHHAMLSLETAPPNDLPPVPSEDILCATLLQLFNALNDRQQMAKYTECLSSALATAEIDEEYYRKRLLVHTAQIKLGIQMDHIISEYRKDIDARCRLLQEGNTKDLDKWGVSIAYWYVAMLSLTNDLRRLNATELCRCEQLLRYFLDHAALFSFNNIQLAFTYLELARIEWAQKKNSAVSTMQKSLQYCRRSVISNDIKVTILRAAAELFYDYPMLTGTSSLLTNTAEEMMVSITNAWQSATKYLNDYRLSQILASVQAEFDRCYALLRSQTDVKTRYTYILRFKNLAALVGRERNQILQTNSVDETLKASIHLLQNQLVAAEFDDARQGTNRAPSIQKELLHMEAKFAKSFPDSLYQNEITYEKIAHALSDGEAVVEYYFSQHPCADCVTDIPLIDLEIFVCTKVDGRSQLYHAMIPDGHRLLDRAVKFTNILQNSSEASSRSGEKVTLRAELYRNLLAPVLPFLKGIKTIYIAPDRELFNLPFEILCADGSGLLQEHFRVCRIASGRDVLYFSDHPTFSEGAFFLGDPAYGPDRSTFVGSKGEDPEISTVCELPFSGVEVARISKYINGSVCTRESATKFALSQAGPCRVIHLATHGSFDREMESNALYSSYLIFAGYNNWIIDNKKRKECDNGILTADEISRLDLRGTELVVLSACLSGMGDITYGTMQGLLSAFSATGVRWVISHVWKANDFTTPILMDAFYDAYLNRKLAVPDALQYAKCYLSTVTVGELRGNGWFTPPDTRRLSADTKEYLSWCNKSIDRRKLFQDEAYWGGFVVYRCQ